MSRVGSILDTLEALKVADQTIVLFMSDNGGLSAHGRGGERHTHNAPLRSGKGSAYEGGVRVPMVVRWPGAVAAGGRSSVPVIIEDFYPTVLAMAGAEIPFGYKDRVDGLDLTPLLRDEAWHPRDRVLGWHYPHKWGGNGPGVFPYSAVLKGEWKLIFSHRDGRFELFDLHRDLAESENLAPHDPRKLREMAVLLDRWLEEKGAQMSLDPVSGAPLPGPLAHLDDE